MATETFNVVLPKALEIELRRYYDNLINQALEEAINNHQINSPYLRLSGLSEYLQVSKQTLIKWKKLGMPSITIDGVVLFSKKEVSDWLNKFEM